MAKLSYNGMTWTVDHAVKGPDYIHGYSSDGELIVAIEHTSDFDSITFGGTYMSPEECFTESCNTVVYVNGKLARIDGTELSVDAIGAAASEHKHSASDINSGTLDVSRGGTGKATHTSNSVLTGNGTSAVKNVATASGALYATAANGAAKFGTLPIAQGGTGATAAADALENLGAAPSSHNHSTSNITSGTLGVARGGTGKATHTSNAVLTGNGTSAVNNVATASGALYATAANGAAKFGTLPVAQGGTGATSAAAALTKLGGVSIKKLWENGTPTDTFAAKTLSIALTDYSMVLCLCRLTDETDTVVPPTLAVVGASYGSYAYGTVSGKPVRRTITATTSGVTFEDACRYTSFGSTSTDKVNTNLIPVAIYGIKGVT